MEAFTQDQRPENGGCDGVRHSVNAKKAETVPSEIQTCQATTPEGVNPFFIASRDIGFSSVSLNSFLSHTIKAQSPSKKRRRMRTAIMISLKSSQLDAHRSPGELGSRQLTDTTKRNSKPRSNEYY